MRVGLHPGVVQRKEVIMVAAYLRYSTGKQDEVQQVQALKEWTEPRGIAIDTIEKDEGVSGGVSYRNRNLNRLVKTLKAGDTLLVSEISRLGRSMSDISSLLSEELRPRKIRLVVIKSGIDVDCSNLKATDEFIFSALSFAAQVEKELIQARTQAAIDARKELIKTDGGFISKAGVFRDHLGNKKGCDMSPAWQAGAQKLAAEAEEWRKRSPLYIWTANQILKGRPRKEILAEAAELYEDEPEKFGTREGKMLSKGLLSRWAAEIVRRS